MGVIPKLRLFKIEEDGKPPVYFYDKRLAKRKRHDLCENGKPDTVVMRGPDHRRGESFNESKQGRRYL